MDTAPIQAFISLTPCEMSCKMVGDVCRSAENAKAGKQHTHCFLHEALVTDNTNGTSRITKHNLNPVSTSNFVTRQFVASRPLPDVYRSFHDLPSYQPIFVKFILCYPLIS